MSECYFCNETERLETHHVVPRRFGGTDEDENLVEVCPTCHSKLEKLYNKRFYNSLGVEKPDETLEYECSYVDCGAQATTTFQNGGVTICACDSHNECSIRACNKNASVALSGNDEIALFCSDHLGCRVNSCGAEASRLVQYAPTTHLRVCDHHAGEYDTTD